MLPYGEHILSFKSSPYMRIENNFQRHLLYLETAKMTLRQYMS